MGNHTLVTIPTLIYLKNKNRDAITLFIKNKTTIYKKSLLIEPLIRLFQLKMQDLILEYLDFKIFQN